MGLPSGGGNTTQQAVVAAVTACEQPPVQWMLAAFSAALNELMEASTIARRQKQWRRHSHLLLDTVSLLLTHARCVQHPGHARTGT